MIDKRVYELDYIRELQKKYVSDPGPDRAGPVCLRLAGSDQKCRNALLLQRRNQPDADSG